MVLLFLELKMTNGLPYFTSLPEPGYFLYRLHQSVCMWVLQVHIFASITVVSVSTLFSPLLIVFKHECFLWRSGYQKSTWTVSSGAPLLLKHDLFAHFQHNNPLPKWVEICSQKHSCSDNLFSATLNLLFGNVSFAWFYTFHPLTWYLSCVSLLNLKINKLGKLIHCRTSTNIGELELFLNEAQMKLLRDLFIIFFLGSEDRIYLPYNAHHPNSANNFRPGSYAF